MATVLFFAFLCFFFWLIFRLPFYRKPGLPVILFIILFGIRALAGVLYCYLCYHYFPVSDALTFHNISLNENYLLLNNPKTFFYDLVYDKYHNHYGGLFSSENSFWNDLRENLIVKSLAVADIFTLKNFYTNTLIYNFIVFSGCVPLYRALQPSFSNKKRLLIFGVFLFPSALFFTSGIQKDGLILMSLGFLIYSLTSMLNGGITAKKILVFLLSLLLIFLLRNFVALILIVSIVLWLLLISFQDRKWLITGILSCICIFLFFGFGKISATADFPQIISKRSADFDSISRFSNTYLPLGRINPDFPGFVKSAPGAIYHAFFLPNAFAFHGLKSVPFFLELYAVWGFLIMAIIRKKRKGALPALFWSLSFFSLVNIILIGYTIPNLGAILRYRSLFLQLIFLCIAAFYRKDYRTKIF